MDKHFLAARKVMNDYIAIAEPIYERRFREVIEAFRKERVSYSHFNSTTGYGYNDVGRDGLENIYSDIFHCEASLVRQQIVSGSHAIYLAIFGNLRPGDELVTIGLPYDTLQTVLGLGSRKVTANIQEMGIKCRALDVDFAHLDSDFIVKSLSDDTKMVAMQRSRGYSWRSSLTISQIREVTAAIKKARPDIIVFCDNCYGEFVEELEPTDVGVDLIAGSLIKNPGAGIAPGGGYICGKEDYVNGAAYKLTFPGAGREVGASLTDNRMFYQSIFLAPQIVFEAVLGAVYCSSLLQGLGFNVSPLPEEKRTDIIQVVQMDSSERLCAFCQGIQRYSPVDSFVAPIPSPMPGYDNDIIMAAGGFVAGSSIELSADAPLRDPYLLFVQGGLNRYHTIYAVENTLMDMKNQGLL